ncbi:Metalloreductase STEAP4 [Tetrabaena socialis]|uniref:Metalloreductase STEAP4 n=1 Tax=Tetrabaena socialis TaxID=47790 RepID=A0A2J7ZYN2_9CHLO|nr:Metalloreductase STEAP4 [Tetrabaena socialis]|eukprot:PNH05383.1 Metalloreductase STEAP4 [Tetrabaena socialis]
MRVAVIGTGPMAQGLCSLATRSGATSGNVEMRMCSRRAEKGSETFLEGLPLTPISSMRETLEWSEIVVLAVQASQIPAIVAEHGHLLVTRVVLDITNPSRADIDAIAAAARDPSPSPATSSSPGTTVIAVDCDRRPRDSAGSAYGGFPTAPAPALVVDRRPPDSAVDSAYGGFPAAPAPAPEAAEAAAKPAKLGLSSSQTSWVGSTASASASAAHALSALLSHAAEGSPVRVVKALNNVSAYALIHSDPLVDDIKTVAASDDANAAKLVRTLLEAMGVDCRVVPSLSYAVRMEGWHRGTFAEWQMPCWVMFVSLVLMWVFSAVRYNHYDHVPWYQATMWITNKALGWAGLWGLLYCYLPGMATTYAQLFRRTPTVRLWRWVQRWMEARKQLGLLSLLFVMLHLALSTYLWMPSYYTKLWQPTDVLGLGVGPAGKLDKYGMAPAASLPKQAIKLPASASAADATANATAAATAAGNLIARSAAAVSIRRRLNWQGEASMLVGILAGFSMLLTGLTSLPHITHRLNWGEWVLAQSWLGWFSFCAATAHTLILGITWWPTAATAWPAMIPTITLLSTAPCVIVIAGKLLLMSPPVAFALARIRAGVWGKASQLHAIYVSRHRSWCAQP